MNRRQKLVQQEFLNNEEAVIKRLKQVYNQSLKDVNDKVKNLELQIGDLTEEYDWMDDDDPQKEIMRSRIQSKIYQKQYQEALQGQLDEVLKKMQTKQFLTVSDYLDECYTDGFVGTVFDQHGQGVPLIMPIDQEAMVRAVQLDSKISQGLYTRLGEDVALLKKKITAQVSRGVATGMGWKQVAKQLEGYTNIGFNRAVRIARTEGHRIQCTAAMDAMIAAKDKGADVLKQWDATLDDVTRESHRQVDGEIRELDEEFSNHLMYAGDPAGGAAEVVNCRCALLQRARWALDEDELQTLKDRAAYFGLDKSEEFDGFKKKYLKAVEEPPVVVQKPTFVPAKTIGEAEDFIRQYVDEKGFGALGVSYTGISLDAANEVNRAISKVFTTFNIKQLGGVIAPAGNTKLGKMLSDATAAYSPIRKSLLLNRKSLKDLKTAAKHFEAEKNAIQGILEHPERYDLTKISSRMRSLIERSKVSGRSTVPDCVEDAINHELGHALEKQVVDSPKWADALANKPTFADKISGYAGDSSSEYIAESFASYMKGETVIDPVMVEIFESLMR